MAMIRDWRHVRSGKERGYTLIELMIVIAVIGILAAIALQLYANLETQARIGKAQADLRTAAGAVAAFAAYCGSAPQSPRTWSAAVAPRSGTASCTTARGGSVNRITQVVTDPNGLKAGPFLAHLPTPPTGWTYEYSASGPDTYTFVGTSPTDLPTGNITYP